MSDFTMPCPVCDKQVNFLNDDHFSLEYNFQNQNRMSNNGVVFFHPECFISAAGKDWALRCGYKFEKSQEPAQEPPKTFSSGTMNLTVAGDGNISIVYGEPT